MEDEVKLVPLVLAALLALLTLVRAGDLLEYRGAHFIDLEVSRWADKEKTEALEAGLGEWLHQFPDDGLRVRFDDDRAATDTATLRAGDRSVKVPLALGAEDLREPFTVIASRVGLPRRLHVLRTDYPGDRALAAAVHELARKAGWQVSEIAVVGDALPPLSSGPGDWIVVAKDVARAHLAALLRIPGRKIFELPPYRQALATAHPDLWFLTPWDPRVEYFPERPVSSCRASARSPLDRELWPLDATALHALAAMDVLLGPEPRPDRPAPIPLTLIGPSADLRSVQAYRSGRSLPACPAFPDRPVRVGQSTADLP